jgi:hypothetical protein
MAVIEMAANIQKLCNFVAIKQMVSANCRKPLLFPRQECTGFGCNFAGIK